jgi:hypothetical protein
MADVTAPSPGDEEAGQVSGRVVARFHPSGAYEGDTADLIASPRVQARASLRSRARHAVITIHLSCAVSPEHRPLPRTDRRDCALICAGSVTQGEGSYDPGMAYDELLAGRARGYLREAAG